MRVPTVPGSTKQYQRYRSTSTKALIGEGPVLGTGLAVGFWPALPGMREGQKVEDVADWLRCECHLQAMIGASASSAGGRFSGRSGAVPVRRACFRLNPSSFGFPFRRADEESTTCMRP
jgi:hypothetical protein